MLWSGWQSDIAEGIADSGKVPWVFVFLMAVWYHTLANNVESWYAGIVNYFGPDYGPAMAGPVMAWTFHMIFYHSHSAIYAYLDSHDGPWKKYKLTTTDKMTWSQMLPNVVKNQCIFLVSGVAAFFASDGRGWDGSKPWSEVPWNVFFFDMLSMYIVYEAIFYTNHRILHITKLSVPFMKKPVNLYALFHKEHHSTYASVGVSGLYMGSIDCVLTQTLPQVVAPALFDFHPFTLWLFALIGSLNAVHTHSGYDLWGMSAPHGHELHHSRYKVNYGTGFLDNLLNTKLYEHEVVREGYGLGGRLVKDVEKAKAYKAKVAAQQSAKAS
ncbi:hypothetical protein TrST_g12997 [Triparma strigata]|uniref:Fatty acid hydroxylase domain-containing protein n=1 Tax=Triparma strigata TaxID=1606541 RepID=A0A9W7E0R8_9STRA|nr:hypothetical protein TrST_g12997 [Triparma strigata]